jgi:enoyl-CoA hydratase/carnithine racemase
MLSTEMTTGPSDLLSELNAGVSTLTPNRPSARNALSAALLAALNSDGIDSTIYVQRLAQRATAGPSVAYRYMKENLNRAIAGEAEDCLDLEATHHIHCSRTADHREAARVFVNKREPVFKGR